MDRAFSQWASVEGYQDSRAASRSIRVLHRSRLLHRANDGKAVVVARRLDRSDMRFQRCVSIQASEPPQDLQQFAVRAEEDLIATSRKP
ncbi:MAG TPA: hypothetical protein VGG42_18945 [Acidobacteriaceae bacterium]|jgi:hypothetical protein